jgi:hypothetical protein
VGVEGAKEKQGGERGQVGPVKVVHVVHLGGRQWKEEESGLEHVNTKHGGADHRGGRGF